jgi:hypothetical protein
MLHGGARMGIVLNAHSRDEVDRGAPRFAEAMPIITRDGDYLSVHGLCVLPCLTPEHLRHRIELGEIAARA